MIGFVLKRLAYAPVLLATVTFLIFVMISLMPGDPAVLLAGENPTPQQISEVRQSLRLNDPLLVRYARWAEHAVTGDFGRGYETGYPSVARTLAQRLPVTLSIAVLAVLTSLIGALVVGTIAAVRPNSLFNRAVTWVCALAVATPSYWLGYLLVVWFAVTLGLLPSVGYRPPSEGLWPWFSHLVLPAVALGANPFAAKTLQLRGALMEVLGSEYILNARAKGLGGVRVVGKHALKNALAPIVTLLGFDLTHILGGAVVVETVFAIPGMGSLVVAATLAKDLPMLLGAVAVSTVVVIVVNTVADLAYAYLNPKVRVA